MLKRLTDDQHALLASAEGIGAFFVLLPLLRELAMHIAGRGPVPRLLRELPELQMPIAVERARYRAMAARGEVK